MARRYRTTEDDMTPEQRAERDRQLENARKLTDQEVAELRRVSDAAYARAIAKYGNN